MYKISDYKILATSQSLPKETVDYGVKMLGTMYEWHETMGEGIRVGVIDTGIDLNHEDLRGRIKEYINFTSKYTNDVEDTNGHGTHVAGSICANRNGIGVVGAAPKCDLYIAKAFGTDGHAQTESIIKSFDWLISKKVHVINMSFSASEPNEYEKMMIKKCYDNGIVLVGAAGNDGGKGDEDTIGYPAKYEKVIAVTAVDMNLNRAPFSSQGNKAQVAAAGTNILSTYKNNTYAVLSGTSMATPLITGAAAILQGKSKIRFGRFLTPDELSLVMNIYADDLGFFGKDNQLGYGLFSFGRFFV
ncbi:MAG: S8 family peptidase [Clostridia bacterium]|nr:S8 family peptidase [Clostridia bacterium]